MMQRIEDVADLQPDADGIQSAPDTSPAAEDTVLKH